MKKFLFLIALCAVTMVTTAQNFPFGAAQYQLSTSDSVTVSMTTNNNVAYLRIDSTTLDVNTTVNVTANSFLKRGAILYIECQGHTPAVTLAFGTGLDSPTLTCTATKTFVTAFIYNGTTYKAFAQKQTD